MEKLKIKIVMKNIKNLLANANIVINTDYGDLTIKGFCIWNSNFVHPKYQDMVNITPPAIMKYGKSFPYIYFEDKESWEAIEEQIYNAYFLEKNKGNIKKETIPLQELDTESITI